NRDIKCTLCEVLDIHDQIASANETMIDSYSHIVMFESIEIYVVSEIVGNREKNLFFFFQAEDGIRDYKVTGVQTCALPISVPDERGHRVPARKAPAEVLEERGGTGRPRAANQELEHHIEQAAAGEGREPADEQDPLTAGREHEADGERQDRQRHRRAEGADRIEYRVPRGCGTCVQPIEQRYIELIELGERVMVDD